MKFTYMDIKTTDPAFNLALEQYAFDILPHDRTYFLLWQNDNAIIVGKYQNTMAEINDEFVKEHGIKVVRRLSGGGAVYHDMGNLNFTFITDAENLENINFHLFCEPIVKALAEMGVVAEINGRNDITIDGKKFSGNSQYIKKQRVMHHGTIMFDSNLGVVSKALQVDESKLENKGAKSVRSRVTNVKDHLNENVELSTFRAALLKNILGENEAEEYIITDEDSVAIEKLKREVYDTWEWNYGRSPECTFYKKRRVEGCGSIEAYLLVKNGLIDNVQFRGDFFSLREPEELADVLVGIRPEREEYRRALKDIDVNNYFSGLDKESLIDILIEQ